MSDETRSIRQRKPTALLVDDHATVRRALRGRLEGMGLDVSEAATALDALREASVARPDVVVLDVHMPGHDGLWALERLLEADPGARVVVMSAADAGERLSEAERRGAVAGLRKDASIDTWRVALDRALNSPDVGSLTEH